MKSLRPVDRHKYETNLYKDQELYEIYPWMGIVKKAKINDIDIHVKVVIKWEEGRAHKYLDVAKYKKLYNNNEVNILKIWTDKPYGN